MPGPRRCLPALALLVACTAPRGPAPGPSPSPAAGRARNVILFLADAGGLPTLNGASIHAFGQPRGLFLHTLPHVALAETSSASEWVVDSAAGMTAIVTGVKTHNGVVSQSEAAVRRTRDGAPLKTILEHAEGRGLSTGIVTNSSVLSATPAACYAHVNDRSNEAEVLRQLLRPRFGDGVDVLIGHGLHDVGEAARASGLVAADALRGAGLPLYDSLETLPGTATRAAVLFPGGFDLEGATARTIEILARNPKGYFLMVEGDMHVERLRGGLDAAAALDRALRRAAGMVGADTLIVFTADHSYDFRIHDGLKGQPLLPAGAVPGEDEDSVRLPNVRRDDDHTAEDVLVAARGPGAERVKGFLSNTDLFGIMMAAYGWH